MRTLLAKSYRLNRYHTLIVIIIVALLSWLMLRFFLIAYANIERTMFLQNLASIQRFFYIKQLVEPHNQGCVWLKKSDVFEKAAFHLNAPYAKTEHPVSQQWVYDNHSTTLTYWVKTRNYFRSNQGHKIVIRLSCVKGRIHFQVSQHQWCQDMSIWGCHRW